MSVGGYEIWAVQWMGEHFPGYLNQLQTGGICNVESGTVVEEVDDCMFRALPFTPTGQKIQLLAMRLQCHAGAGRQQFKQEHDPDVP